MSNSREKSVGCQSAGLSTARSRGVRHEPRNYRRVEREDCSTQADGYQNTNNYGSQCRSSSLTPDRCKSSNRSSSVRRKPEAQDCRSVPPKTVRPSSEPMARCKAVQSTSSMSERDRCTNCTQERRGRRRSNCENGPGNDPEECYRHIKTICERACRDKVDCGIAGNDCAASDKPGRGKDSSSPKSKSKKQGAKTESSARGKTDKKAKAEEAKQNKKQKQSSKKKAESPPSSEGSVASLNCTSIGKKNVKFNENCCMCDEPNTPRRENHPSNRSRNSNGNKDKPSTEKSSQVHGPSLYPIYPGQYETPLVSLPGPRHVLLMPGDIDPNETTIIDIVGLDEGDLVEVPGIPPPASKTLLKDASKEYMQRTFKQDSKNRKETDSKKETAGKRTNNYAKLDTSNNNDCINEGRSFPFEKYGNVSVMDPNNPPYKGPSFRAPDPECQRARPFTYKSRKSFVRPFTDEEKKELEEARLYRTIRAIIEDYDSKWERSRAERFLTDDDLMDVDAEDATLEGSPSKAPKDVFESTDDCRFQQYAPPSPKISPLRSPERNRDRNLIAWDECESQKMCSDRNDYDNVDYLTRTPPKSKSSKGDSPKRSPDLIDLYDEDEDLLDIRPLSKSPRSTQVRRHSHSSTSQISQPSHTHRCSLAYPGPGTSPPSSTTAAERSPTRRPPPSSTAAERSPTRRPPPSSTAAERSPTRRTRPSSTAAERSPTRRTPPPSPDSGPRAGPPSKSPDRGNSPNRRNSDRDNLIQWRSPVERSLPFDSGCEDNLFDSIIRNSPKARNLKTPPISTWSKGQSGNVGDQPHKPDSSTKIRKRRVKAVPLRVATNVMVLEDSPLCQNFYLADSGRESSASDDSLGVINTDDEQYLYQDDDIFREEPKRMSNGRVPTNISGQKSHTNDLGSLEFDSHTDFEYVREADQWLRNETECGRRLSKFEGDEFLDDERCPFSSIEAIDRDECRASSVPDPGTDAPKRSNDRFGAELLDQLKDPLETCADLLGLTEVKEEQESARRFGPMCQELIDSCPEEQIIVDIGGEQQCDQSQSPSTPPHQFTYSKDLFNNVSWDPSMLCKDQQEQFRDV